jgi:urocanate hydratase
VICGCIGIVAEVSYEAIKKRYDQGWVLEIIDDLDALMKRVQAARKTNQVLLGFLVWL